MAKNTSVSRLAEAIDQLAEMKCGWLLAAANDAADFVLDVIHELRTARDQRDAALAAASRPYMDGEIIAAYEGWVDYGDEYDSFSTSKAEVGGDVTPVTVFFVKREA